MKAHRYLSSAEETLPGEEEEEEGGDDGDPDELLGHEGISAEK